MAGVRKSPQPNGKYVGWYIDASGKQRSFVGTRKKAATLAAAQKLEDDHRQVRIGYREPPKSSDKHRSRPFSEVANEYLEWGKSQGGRGGRPWAFHHTRRRVTVLAWWGERLGLDILGDVDGILSKVEAALRDLQSAGRPEAAERHRKPLSGKTLANYAETITAFCDWCETRGYLREDPLKRLAGFDMTPKTQRRAMTAEEIRKLLDACTPERRLVYETALTSGLRLNELYNLKVKHFDAKRGGLELDAAWTKNRKTGFQPLPGWLVEKLAASVTGKPETDRLLKMRYDAAHGLDWDLERAKIPKWAPGGKIDFHALRVAFVTYVLESGANVREAQALARHATPELTMNVYAKTRSERLSAVAEAVGKIVNPVDGNAVFMQKVVGGVKDESYKNNSEKALRPVSEEYALRESNQKCL